MVVLGGVAVSYGRGTPLQVLLEIQVRLLKSFGARALHSQGLRTAASVLSLKQRKMLQKQHMIKVR